MNAFIYNSDTRDLVKIIHGIDNNDCENQASELGYMGVDEYELSYVQPDNVSENLYFDDLYAELECW